MQNKNIDGIKFTSIVRKRRPKRQKFLVDSIVKVNLKIWKQTSEPAHFIVSSRQNKRFFWFLQFRPSLIILVIVLTGISFIAGAWFTLKTDKSLAEDHVGILQSQTVPLPILSVEEGGAGLGPINKIPNEILFNLTLDQLEGYLTEVIKTPEVKEAENLADRKFKLKIYLAEKKSPLIGIADTIAELKHWKMVLAISNSESTLGKFCANNNCSGIGVEPGHPLWREYGSKAEWAKDLDRLIEKRYKDWTLEKMNGVYNQPGSQNWLFASRQILEELQERGIE